MQNSATIRKTQPVAHDLARYDPRSRVRDAVRAQPAPQKVIQKAAVKVKPRMRVSPVAVALFLAGSALAILIVYSYMQVSLLNTENQLLQSELKALRKQENELNKSMEGAYDLAEVEAYAINELGMVKVDGAHMITLDLSGEDKGEVVFRESAWDAVRRFFKALAGAAVSWVD